MTGLERCRNMLEGKPCDIVPRVPILMQFAAEYIGSNYGAFASDYRVLVEANLRCAEDFGMDQVSCISDPYRETQGFGGKIEYVPDGVPRCTAPMEGSKDFDVLATPDPGSSERMLDRVRAAEMFKAQAGDRYSILGWIEGPAAEAGDLRGVSRFMMDLYDDESFACELMERCTEVAIDFAHAQIEAGCDTIGMGDALCSQLPPDLYERLIQPLEKRIVDAVQEAGACLKLHICGNITHLLPGIAGLGVDILDVDHMVDMAQVRKAVGDKVTLAGNIDPAEAVLRGTPDAIRAGFQEVYDTVGNPFMVNAGCEIPSGTPNENLKAVCEPIAFAGRRESTG